MATEPVARLDHGLRSASRTGMRHVYSLIHYLLMPGALLQLTWRALTNRDYRDRWWERFGFSPAIEDAERSIWIHAVSVGEVQAALPLVHALRDRAPRLPVVVTTSTPTGRDRVLRALGTQVHRSHSKHAGAGQLNDAVTVDGRRQGHDVGHRVDIGREN